MNNNQSEKIEIRPYKQSDLNSLYEICLLTGDSGKDATNNFKDQRLLGDFYAAPYVKFEPELTFVATLNNQPSGYIVGTQNSELFSKKCESEWLPKLRQKYELPNENDKSAEANIIRLIYRGHIVKLDLVDYPAHLHINLLPNTQGKGIGRKIMNAFINNLRTYNVSALHLEVGKRNPGAIAFYKKVGFHIIIEYENSIAFGMKL